MSKVNWMGSIRRVVAVVILGFALFGGGFVLGQKNKSSSSASGGATSDAAKGVEAIFRAEVNGDYNTYYDHLHPKQQALVDKAVFIKCVARPLATPVPEVKALDSFAQAANLDVANANEAQVVTVQFKSPTGTSARVAYTVFADGRWRWLLGENEFNAYQDGRCS